MDDLKLVLKEREKDSHKGENGTVLVIGGSKDFVGAPALAGLAALRTGIDLVVVAAPYRTAWTINTYSPDLITKKLHGEFFVKAHARQVFDMVPNFDVICIGSGMATRPETESFVREVCSEVVTRPKVIDADAIKALHGMQVANAVFTPHAKEFEIYTGQKLPDKEKEKTDLLKSYASRETVFLLKGPVDLITDGSRVRRNTTGNPGMTVGGTGDVLAGLCAGLLAHNTGDKFHAACAAAFLNGKIGDELYRKMGYGFTAGDMIHEIPASISRCLR
ncbi:NAD(P)H-hydrate dehydratase [Candidatus Woesearchaeota archaeon]|nr:NAD(P)H-hydrate dehydratase [Candidatus Woesearchaeota archaeon]